MALRQPFLIVTVTVTLWVRLILSGNVTGSDSENMCYRGHTGPDNGGSCTFTTGLCGWTVTGVNTKWEVKDEEAYASTYWTSEGTKATLTSPWLCEDSFITICIQFYYKFDYDDGGQLTLRLCNTTASCEVLWSKMSGDKTKWFLCQVSKNLTLTKSDLFQIQIEAKKIDTWGPDTNFYLDDIVYNNTSCPNEPMTHSTQHPFLTTTDTDADFLTAKTTHLSAVKDDEQENSDVSGNTTNDEESPRLLMISAIVAVLLLTAAVVVVVVYFRRQRTDGDVGSKKSSISREPLSSIAMVTNELYEMTDVNQSTEDNISLQDLDLPQDHDTYYCMVQNTNRGHEVYTQSDPGGLEHQGCANLRGRETYENVHLGSVHPQAQQPLTLDVSLQDCNDQPQEANNYCNYCP